MATRRRKNSGFTLIEVMLTGAILAFGIVSIYEALFVSVDAHGYYTRYLNAHDWINEKMWSIHSDLIDRGSLQEGDSSGEFVRGHKAYQWTASIMLMNDLEKLYRLDLKLKWKEGERIRSTQRVTYIMPAFLKNYGEESSV